MSTVGAPDTAPRDEGAPPAPGSETLKCPRCGAGLREDQDWCLNCGAAVTTEVRRPPNWRLPVAVVGTVLLLALGALAIAFLEVAEDGEVVAQATPTATPSVTPVPTPTPTPDPATGAVTPAPEGTDGAIDPPPGGDTGETDEGTADLPTDDGTTGTDGLGADADGTDGLGTDSGGTDSSDTDAGDSTTGSTGGDPQSWPDGEAAWTVVLFSGDSREDAEARAQELQASGRSVGVLDSDDYETLNGGYWVVFSGQYDSRAEAESAAEGLRSDAEGAYPRFVDPR